MPTLRTALRFGYAPFLLVGANGLAFVAISRGAPAWILGGLLLGAVGLSFAAERLLPYNVDWNRSHGDRGRDLAHAIVNETANFGTLLLVPLLTGLAPAAGLWPVSWPFLVQVGFALLVLDAGITLAHYASHRVALLWRFHAVHHSMRRMYGFNGLMKHPIHQSIETLAGTLPLVALGLPGNVAMALVFAVAIQLLLQHSNADYTVGQPLIISIEAQTAVLQAIPWEERGAFLAAAWGARPGEVRAYDIDDPYQDEEGC